MNNFHTRKTFIEALVEYCLHPNYMDLVGPYFYHVPCHPAILKIDLHPFQAPLVICRGLLSYTWTKAPLHKRVKLHAYFLAEDFAQELIAKMEGPSSGFIPQIVK